MDESLCAGHLRSTISAMPGWDEHDDQELIAAANRGEEWGAEALYLRYRNWILQLAYRLTGDREVALDVLQESFVYLLSRFPGFELRCPMKGFLYPVVRFRCAQVFRNRGPRLRSLEEAEIDPPAQERAGRGDAVEALTQVLGQLGEVHREVMILRFVDGLPLSAIAEAMEIPIGTVKSRLHKAVLSLREDPRTRKIWDH